MRKVLFATTAVLTMLAGAAHATIIFTPGNNPGATEENILFQSKYTGVTSFIGHTNMTGVPILFDLVPGALNGELSFGTVGVGQSDIVCSAGCGTDNQGGANGSQLTDLEIKLAPGFGATDFIANLDFGEGTFTISVLDQMGANFDFDLTNGQNFFTLNAINGEVITDILISGKAVDGNGNLGFNSFKQPRISGLCTLQGATCTAIPVPEPSSLAIFGAGILAVGWLKGRKKFLNFA